MKALRFPKLPEISIPKENGKKAIIIFALIVAMTILIAISSPKIVNLIGGSSFQITNESISVVQCFYYQNSNGLVTITALVQNIGRSNAVITSVYVYDINGLEIASNTSLLITIPPRKASPVFVSTVSLQPGSTYRISVFTQVGTSSSCQINYK